jgi:hypothetical protein
VTTVSVLRPYSGTRDKRLIHNERLLTVPHISLVLDRAGVEQAGVDQDGGDAVLGAVVEGWVLPSSATGYFFSIAVSLSVAGLPGLPQDACASSW